MNTTPIIALTRLALALVCFLAACTPSLQPFYTEKDLVFEPALAGSFSEDKEDPVWTFKKSGERAYELVIKEGEKRSSFSVHLFKLAGEQYLDLYASQNSLEDCPREDFLKSSLVPGHLVMKTKIGPGLHLQILDEDWLKTELKSRNL